MDLRIDTLVKGGSGGLLVKDPAPTRSELFGLKIRYLSYVEIPFAGRRDLSMQARLSPTFNGECPESFPDCSDLGQADEHTLTRSRAM